MSYSVRCYLNTGFNGGNYPDSESLLNQCEYIDVPSIDTLQDNFLSSVRIRVTWSQINTCDYVKIGSYFYTVSSIGMHSVDVAELELLPDYLLSAGGVSNIDILDGVTERVHVPVSDDVFGGYCASDEYCKPSQPLRLSYYNVHENLNNYYVFVESTVDLISMATNYEALTFEDASISGNEVVVPQPTPVTTYTQFILDSTHSTTRSTAVYILGECTGGNYVENTTIRDGLSRCRSLGVESCIIATYRIPKAYVSPIHNGPLVTSMQSVGFKVNATELTYTPTSYGTIHNKRTYYGEYNKYGVMGMSGNKTEFNAEDIYHSGDTFPEVFCYTDTRPDGKPYYRYRFYHSADGTDNGLNQPSATFWQNCVDGEDWEVVPIVYTEKSGNELTRFSYEADRVLVDTGNDVAQTLNTISYVSDMTTGLAGGNGLEWNAQTNLNAGGVISRTTKWLSNRLALDAMYKVQKDVSRNKFEAMQNVVAPEIKFPYNTKIMRDMIGNGAIVYRYSYTSFDAQRIDKLLTMYGYKHIKSLEKSDFTNRSKFNYVQAQGVTVGSLPKWFADGISAQLSAGVRYWHVLPDNSIYTDGSNT